MIRRILCFFFGHRVRLIGREEDESLHYVCARCGKAWDYYF